MEWNNWPTFFDADSFFIPFAGDCRSYSYVIGLSTPEEPDWCSLLFLAKLIPRILHNINRVCYIFGGTVQYPINDITHTRISRYTLAQLRQADHIATSVSSDSRLNRIDRNSSEIMKKKRSDNAIHLLFPIIPIGFGWIFLCSKYIADASSLNTHTLWSWSSQQDSFMRSIDCSSPIFNIWFHDWCAYFAWNGQIVWACE